MGGERDLMPIQPFSIARLPRIKFGAGIVNWLPELLTGYGQVCCW